VRVPPRNDTEERVLGIWRKLLGRDGIGVRQSFFEVGGHSLLGVQLFAELRRAFGVHLPLATLFEKDTIEQLADVLQQRKGKGAPGPLVAIQPLGSDTPFFCVHAGGGQVLVFRELAQCMGTRRPFYGLSVEDAGEAVELPATIEELAGGYLRAVREVQPSGPYLLGAYCAGGTIALEMAGQLLEEGEQVAALLLFDAFPPRAQRRGRTVKGRVLKHVRKWSLMTPPQRRRYVADEMRRKAGVLWYRLSLRLRKRVPPSHRHFHVMMQLVRMNCAYTPRTFRGNVHLFYSREHQGDGEGVWGPVFGGRENVHRLDARHREMMFMPAVEVLARRVAGVLGEADT
jgi:thioesterase domain-containing protein